MAQLSNRALNRALLARQMLLERHKGSALDAIERLVGLQAQVARPPFVGLWTRLRSFDRRELATALHDRRAVRVTAMRGTLHVMTTADYVAMRGTMQPMLTRGMQAVLRGRAALLEMEALEVEARKFFGKSAATFDALRDHLSARFPDADVRAMAYAIRTHVPLVQVPTEAAWAFPAAADFALADRWLSTKVSTSPTSPEALVLRYLAAFGPATPSDAQAWSGFPALREVFDSLRPSLVTFRDERNRELFDLPHAARPDEDIEVPVRFIPDFDNLVLSHHDRSRIMAEAHRGRVTLKNLQVRATFLVDGLVAGTWRSERKRTAAVLVIEPFGTIPKRVKAALEEEGDALLTFLEEDAKEREVRWAS
ncbi:MAG TPA: winged helix DNA-binding domain-containing protein [Gemmatimonadaceae bacterium]|nr:winged helix DNA-binding domain-containing protein [Gemmatimonadaceae bacterium]